MKRIDIYQTVTDTIIEAIETGIDGKFELPWHRASGAPVNAHTGNLYRGVNVPTLWAWQMVKGYGSATWATYRQWKEIGAQVQKGEKGAQVVLWKSIEIEPDSDNEEQDVRMFAGYFTVFNADQVDGYKAPPAPDFEMSDFQAIAAADNFIEATGANIRHGGGRACYSVTDDYIQLPPQEYFKKTTHSSATENYYSTALHELCHWTGAKERLDRAQLNKFGDADYAFEELVAELGAAMCCSSLFITPTVREDHSQYIGHWLEKLKSDKRFIFAASSQAQKAVDYLFSLQEQALTQTGEAA